ncbi:MAG: biotin transporter BioY [Lachnospiraceae bacterium]|nr:biotin transporter BioY [Lachnospiraceae bacterium]
MDETKTMQNTEAGEKKPWLKTLDMVYIGMFVAIMAVCSWISVPTTVPFTLQTFAVVCAVLMLGFARGTVAVIVYILLGLVGVPVFAGFTGGLGKLAGPTGGYIVGFIFTALITGAITAKFGKKIYVEIIAAVLGLAVCYVFGTVWFMILGSYDLPTALAYCVIPFLLPEVVKIALAILVDKSVSRVIRI